MLFIVMECLPGPSLADELRREEPMSFDRVIAVLTDVLDGLEAAHAKGVLHRDIKPSNVLIDTDGRAKLADFGIATTAEADLTNTGVVIGTPAYLAPERVAGRRATVRSDLYAVGVIAYEAVAGTRPFAGDSPLALAHAIHEGKPRPLRELPRRRARRTERPRHAGDGQPPRKRVPRPPASSRGNSTTAERDHES